MAVASRLTPSGNLSIQGNFDEVTALAAPLPISFVSSAVSVQNTSSTTITVTVPTVSNGQLMIMSVSASSITANWITPSGWTALPSNSSGRNTFWKTANFEPASYTVTLSGSYTSDAIITVYANAKIDQVGNYGIPSGTPTPGSITVTNPNSWIYYYISALGVASDTFTTPTGYTARSSDSDATQPSAAVFDISGISSGSYTAPSSTALSGTPQSFILSLSPIVPATKLYSNGSLGVSGGFDEVSLPFLANTGSLFFNGTSSALTIPQTNNLLSLGQGQWTIEWWFYTPSTSTIGATSASMWFIGDYGNEAGIGTRYLTNNTTINTWITTAGGTTTSTHFAYNGNVATDTWHHAALMHVGTNAFQFYLDGTSIYANDTNVLGVTTAYGMHVGSGDSSVSGNFGNQYWYPGYISNFRISNGQVYTSNFTPSPNYGADGTTILWLKTPNIGSNAFADYGPNSFTVYANGSPTSFRFSPFQSNTAAVSTNTTVAQRIYPNGNLQIQGIFDEQNKPV